MKPTDTTESRRQAVIDAAEKLVTGSSPYVPSEAFFGLEKALFELRHGRDAIAIEQAGMAKPADLADGLWNIEDQSPVCYAKVSGDWHVIDEAGYAGPIVNPAIPNCMLRPNTWPIPEAAKAKLRELGLKLDDDEEAVIGKEQS